MAWDWFDGNRKSTMGISSSTERRRAVDTCWWRRRLARSPGRRRRRPTIDRVSPMQTSSRSLAYTCKSPRPPAASPPWACCRRSRPAWSSPSRNTYRTHTDNGQVRCRTAAALTYSPSWRWAPCPRCTLRPTAGAREFPTRTSSRFRSCIGRWRRRLCAWPPSVCCLQ